MILFRVMVALGEQFRRVVGGEGLTCWVEELKEQTLEMWMISFTYWWEREFDSQAF